MCAGQRERGRTVRERERLWWGNCVCGREGCERASVDHRLSCRRDYSRASLSVPCVLSRAGCGLVVVETVCADCLSSSAGS